MFGFCELKVRLGPANPATVTKSPAALPVTPNVTKQVCPKIFPPKAAMFTVTVGVGELSVLVAPAIKLIAAVIGELPLATTVAGIEVLEA